MTTDLTQALHEMPNAGLVPVAVLALLGGLLWAAGGRVMRSAFAACGLVLGGAGGWIAGSSLDLAGVPPWAAAALGAILLACLAVLVYRVAIAGALGLVLAVGAAAGVVTVHELQRRADDGAASEVQAWPAEDDGLDEANRWLFPGFGSTDAEADAADEEGESAATTIGRLGPAVGLGPGATERLAQAESYVDRLLASARAEWVATPETLRTLIVGAAIGGLLLGLLLGTLTPTFSTTVVSAFGGSLLWLAPSRVLLARFGPGTLEWLPQSATVSILLWILVALLGVGIQWMFRPKQADKAG
jgi:hypothetical protein